MTRIGWLALPLALAATIAVACGGEPPAPTTSSATNYLASTSTSSTAAESVIDYLGGTFVDDVPGGAEYVSMGDSFTSVAAYSERFDLDFCARTANNLGHQIAQRLQPTSFTDVPCSGAQLEDLWVPSEKVHFVPQFYSTGPNTRLITVALGINSLEFGTGLFSCMDAPTRTESACAGWADSYREDTPAWREVRNRAVAAITAITERAPNAQIVVVGYPDVFGPTADAACAERGRVPEWAVSAWKTWSPGVNQIGREVAAQFSLDFIEPAAGHDACSADPYVALLGHDAPGGEDAFVYHPNQRGQDAMAAAVADRVGSIKR